MAHFALLDSNNVVQFITFNFVERDDAEEELSARTGNVYKRTSINTRGGIYYDWQTGQPSEDQSKAFRKNYAEVGGIYDPIKDAFIGRKPYPSWILNEDTCIWEAPVSKPDLTDEDYHSVINDQTGILELTRRAEFIWNEDELKWEKCRFNEETNEWVKIEE